MGRVCWRGGVEGVAGGEPKFLFVKLDWATAECVKMTFGKVEIVNAC